MRSKGRHLPIAALVAAGCSTATLGWQPAQAETVRPQASHAPSLLIVENAGQFPSAVRFQVRTPGMTLWVTEDSLWLTRVESPVGEPGTAPPRRGVNLRLTFPGHRAGITLVGTDPLPTKINYFAGSDPNRWRPGVRTYGSLTWHGLYPGVSLSLAAVRGQPALVAHPGPEADLSVLRLDIAGAERIRTSAGRLVADTALGPVELPPIVQGRRLAQVRIRGTHVSFTASPASRGSAVPSEATPAGNAGAIEGQGLELGTFLGGSDDDYVSALAVDPDGSTYVGGWTYSPDWSSPALVDG